MKDSAQRDWITNGCSLRHISTSCWMSDKHQHTTTLNNAFHLQIILLSVYCSQHSLQTKTDYFETYNQYLLTYQYLLLLKLLFSSAWYKSQFLQIDEKLDKIITKHFYTKKTDHKQSRTKSRYYKTVTL